MDPIKNVGANDYAMTMPQQQNDVQVPQEDYSSMPMVYDPEMEDKKKAASSGLGMKALGAIAIAGLALWGGHAWGAKTAEAAKKSESLAKSAMETALKAKDDALKAKDDALAHRLLTIYAQSLDYQTVCPSRHTPCPPLPHSEHLLRGRKRFPSGRQQVRHP